MQNSFTPIYVTKIYEPIFNLPAEIGIAIPLSAEVCTTAIFAWLGGSLKTKLGLKKLLFSGATISLLGFLICGIFVVYLGPLLAPKLEKLFSKKNQYDHWKLVISSSFGTICTKTEFNNGDYCAYYLRGGG